MLGAISISLFSSVIPADAVSIQQNNTYKTFANWCSNKANLSVETRLTVDAILQVVKTQDCNQADTKLSARTDEALVTFQNEVMY
jgi:internalin A